MACHSPSSSLLPSIITISKYLKCILISTFIIVFLQWKLIILMKLTLLTEEKPDDTNKFNGIFRYLQRKNDIIQSQTVIVNQSSQFPFTNTGGDEVHSAECLVYDVNRTGWASVSEPNQYFEFYFQNIILNYLVMHLRQQQTMMISHAIG